MKLLHLYHDLMNLYGDYANVAAMKRILEKSGEPVTVDRLSLGDNADLLNYDFIFIGSGTEKNQRVALEDFRRYTDALNACIDSGKVLLLTGNAFEMLGKAVTDAHGSRFDGLNLFGFTVTEQNKTRNTADAIFEADFLDRPLVGFINKCSEITGIEEPLFRVKMGLGNRKDDSGEGVCQNNLFCTHLTGPVLVKNPALLVYLAKQITGRELSANPLAEQGYEITLSELTKRLEGGE